MTETPLIERLTQLVVPILADLQLALYDIEYAGGILRITIDTPAPPEGEAKKGLDLEAIALVTRLVGRELDHSDPIAGRYTLEVSSPGLERSLRTPAHFTASVGSPVTIRLRDVVEGARRIHGTLVAADDATVTVRLDEPDADGLAERTITYDQIDRARTVFVWQANPKPGGRSRTRQRADARAADIEEAPAP